MTDLELVELAIRRVSANRAAYQPDMADILDEIAEELHKLFKEYYPQ